MAARSYRVKIVRADQQFEVEGDKAFVLQMLRRFESGAVPTAPEVAKHGKSGKGGAVAPLASGKAVSVGEFIRQFQFKKHTDLVLEFGYYLEKHSGLGDFTAADINNCYYEAKMESSNTSQMIIQNIKRGFLMLAKKGDKLAKGARRYTLTQSGEGHLQKAITKGIEQ